MEITGRSKLFDVLKEYPALEEQIVQIAPPFKNLKNPVLRRAVGQMATLAQVAQIGNMDVLTLVNALRRAAGQPELRGESEADVSLPAPAEGDPDWIAGEPQFVVNGTELLVKGDVPLQRVNELLGVLSPGRFILLLTNFEPSPIMDAMQKQGRRVYHKTHPEDPAQRLTFIG